MLIITPATPASIHDTTRSVRTCSFNNMTATTPNGSARPDKVDNIMAMDLLFVTKYTGKATTTPSNILCTAIAMASGSPKLIPGLYMYIYMVRREKNLVYKYKFYFFQKY